ncbi:MAG: phage portal protein [Beijerinckiaceae bacterium]|nr:phage portal protein [Beijerinckiaceae bacterium]
MARRSALDVARERAAIEEARLAAAVAKTRRQQLRAYEATQPTNYHPRRKETRSGDAVMSVATDRLRAIARYLDENHDLAIAVLDDFEAKILGAGVGIEPMVRDRNGSPLVAHNDAIRALLRDYCDARPEVTGEYTWHEAARLALRSWLRDGEVFLHHVEGARRDVVAPAGVPYTFELFEADFLPFHVNQDARQGRARIIHGVEKDGWRRPVAYHLYPEHPGDTGAGGALGLGLRPSDLVRVPAAEITHLKLAKRIGQTRGVTIFHGVLTRLEDLKEYDDSERIAARVASAFTVAVTRAADFTGVLNTDTVRGASRRVLELAPGLIIDDLLPGESVETISSDRPAANYDPYRQANERSIAGGTGASRSSISRRFDSSYSAQRQELVESAAMYGRLAQVFYARYFREIYRRVIEFATLAGRLPLPRAADPATLFDHEIVPPAIGWIDPLKEVQADILEVENGFASRAQVIRKRGRDPQAVDKQIAADTFTQPAAPTKAAPKLQAVGEGA